MLNSLIEQVVYDDAAYHQDAPAFSSGHLDPRNAGTHIGIYLAWLIIAKLESFSLRRSAASAVEEVRNRQTTGREFLFAHCDGRLTADALNKDAQGFTRSYYENQYLRDYNDILVPNANGTYLVVDSWANYERMAAVMNQRFRAHRR